VLVFNVGSVVGIVLLVVLLGMTMFAQKLLVVIAVDPDRTKACSTA
jgi:hypothetical protein